MQPLSVLWLFLPVMGFGLFVLGQTNASAQGTKTTPTVTASAPETPTVTPTYSLVVFETPNTPTADPQLIFIDKPSSGEIVQGVLSITGKTDVKGFSRFEVEFAYQQNPTGTWFLLARGDQPVSEGRLAEWNTNSVTDGDYELRLRVFFLDGSWRDAVVSGISVRNYTSTSTPALTSTPKNLPTSMPTATATTTSTPRPTPTIFPGNTAALSSSEVWGSLSRGAVITVTLFVVFGLILRARKKRI